MLPGPTLACMCVHLYLHIPIFTQDRFLEIKLQGQRIGDFLILIGPAKFYEGVLGPVAAGIR